MTNKAKSDCECYCIKDGDDLCFVPPVYIQRYRSVCEVLMEEKFKDCIKKVVDFGCSNMKFFQYLKRLGFIEHIAQVDIDEGLLSQHANGVAPILCDYLGYQDFQLIVEIFVGSISVQDVRLKNYDAVVCIELIEHLYKDVLEKVPETVFGFIKPRVAIFTTPNADFNILFKLTGFRHDDHKFEWTREEFQKWSDNIIYQYPEYDVYFTGIGPGPSGTSDLGCSTQMAVFYLKNHSSSLFRSDSDDKFTDECAPYKSLKKYEYPYTRDERTSDDRFNDKLKYWINTLTEYYGDVTDEEEYDIFAYIPLKALLPYVEEWCSTVDSLREKLSNTTWPVTTMENEYTIKVDKYNDGRSSSSSSDSE